MQFSNVAGFVFHIANIIILLYSVIFYPETMKSFMSIATYLFMTIVNVVGLFFSASAGVMVNHMVCTYMLALKVSK